ncbi:MAG: hypothetical protein JXB03_01280 [Spirochaetales bacterium]|nr:hypothetical protein [Spirochaetales bacterium]
MNFDPASAHFWSLIACVTLGWGLAGILRRKTDRVTRLVRLSILFSLSIAAMSLVYILQKENTLVFLSRLKLPLFVLFSTGILLRFLPVFVRGGIIVLFAAALVLVSGAFAQVLDSPYRRVFASAVYLNDATIELKILLSPETPRSRLDKGTQAPREESLFITSTDDNLVLGVHRFLPSPFIFQKDKVYYIFDLDPKNQNRIMKMYPPEYTSLSWVFRYFEKLGLIEERRYELEVPSTLLKLYLLSYSETGVPEINLEF